MQVRYRRSCCLVFIKYILIDSEEASASSTVSQKKVRRVPRIILKKRATSQCQATQTDMPTSVPDYMFIQCLRESE